jgi:hypothetical protein
MHDPKITTSGRSQIGMKRVYSLYFFHYSFCSAIIIPIQRLTIFFMKEPVVSLKKEKIQRSLGTQLPETFQMEDIQSG